MLAASQSAKITTQEKHILSYLLAKTTVVTKRITLKRISSTKTAKAIKYLKKGLE